MTSVLNEILDLSQHLIKIPAFSTGRLKNEEGIQKCFHFIVNFLKTTGLHVIEFKNGGPSPALYTDCGRRNENPRGDLLLVGHFDRVSPYHVSQINPVVDGDWLKGRGAADMLTVTATYLVFLRKLSETTSLNPPRIGLLLVGNEEPGEFDKWGTPHVLAALKKKANYKPQIMIAGERTGEGEKKWGQVEVKNRGVIRIKLEATQKSQHSSFITGETALDRILNLLNHIKKGFPKPHDSFWKSTMTISFLNSGETDNFNTLPSSAIAGLEIRPIPEEDFTLMLEEIKSLAKALNIKLHFFNNEPGIKTPIENPHIQKLLEATVKVNGGNLYDYLGKGKLPGSQARFAPENCAAVVFGQSGIGPHSENEAHYIPSIMPYYRILEELGIIYA
jgi:acetylornithine deacetylase/succinyl-diaminopimelate desuccinylase-like protein